MNPLAKRQVSFRAPGHSEARAAGTLLLGGAALVGLWLVLPHPSGGDTPALISTAAAMAATGLLCLLFFRRIPLPATHLILAATAAATGLLIYQSGVAVGQYGSIFVWATLISGYYFTRRIAVAQLVWLLGVYAVSLAVRQKSTAGYSPLTRWLFTAISLTVVMLLTNVIAAHRWRQTCAPGVSSISPTTCSRRWTRPAAASRSTKPGSTCLATPPRTSRECACWT